MADIQGIFGGPFIASSKQADPPELQLADAMRSAGIDPPAKIEIDGQLHRFSTKGRSRDDSGWYIAFPDEPVAGRFGCWRDQIDLVPFTGFNILNGERKWIGQRIKSNGAKWTR